MKLTRDSISIEFQEDDDVSLYLFDKRVITMTREEWDWLCSVTPHKQKEDDNGNGKS